MAVLDIMTYGSYTNKDAVRNVLAYVLRVRDDERRRAELLFWGGFGIPVYDYEENVIKSFLCVQDTYNISSRKGRRIFHETVTMTPMEFNGLGNNYGVLKAVIEEYCYKEYFQQGFQVVYAVHWDKNKSLHVHFVINTINFKDGKKWHTSYEETAERETTFNSILRKYQSPIICGVKGGNYGKEF